MHPCCLPLAHAAGLADPAPVAQTFFVDEDLKEVGKGGRGGLILRITLVNIPVWRANWVQCG